MNNILLRGVNAYISNNREYIVLSFDHNGKFEEYTIHKMFDSAEPWRVQSKSEVDKEVLMELFRQFTDKIAP